MWDKDVRVAEENDPDDDEGDDDSSDSETGMEGFRLNPLVEGDPMMTVWTGTIA